MAPPAREKRVRIPATVQRLQVIYVPVHSPYDRGFTLNLVHSIELSGE